MRKVPRKVAGTDRVPCLTPGAVYETAIDGDRVTVSVRLPFVAPLDTSAAEDLDHALHRALELALAPLFYRSHGPEESMMGWPTVSRVTARCNRREGS